MGNWIVWAIAGAWALLAGVLKSFWDFYNGETTQRYKDIAADAGKVVAANQTTNSADSMSRDDKLQFLERRGRLRSSPSNNNGQ